MEQPSNNDKTILTIGKVLIFAPLLIVVIFSNAPNLVASNQLIETIFTYLPHLVVVGIIIHLPSLYRAASNSFIQIKTHGFTNLLREYIRKERIAQQAEQAKARIENINVKYPLLRRNDPLAKVIKWCPINLGGNSYHSHQLVNIRNSIITRPTKFSYLVYGLIILFISLFLHKLPLIIIGLPLTSNYSWLFLALFIIGFIFLFKRMSSYIIFDGVKKTCSIISGGILHSRTKFISLSSVVALQVINEKVESSSHDNRSQIYQSYELNLIFDSGKRLNLLEHGNLKALEADALMLSNFLEVPAWKLIYEFPTHQLR